MYKLLLLIQLTCCFCFWKLFRIRRNVDPEPLFSSWINFRRRSKSVSATWKISLRGINKEKKSGSTTSTHVFERLSSGWGVSTWVRWGVYTCLKPSFIFFLTLWNHPNLPFINVYGYITYTLIITRFVQITPNETQTMNITPT